LPAKRALPERNVQVTLHRLHDGQARILADPRRFKVVMCGRRFGKTAMGIRYACDGVLAGEPVGWFAPSYKYALEAWRELGERLKPVTKRVSEQDKRLELMTGGVLEVWTLDGDDPARGRKYRRAVIDEAGLVDNLLTVYQSAIRATLVDLSGELLVLGTPKGRRHGFVSLFARGDDPAHPDWASFRASTLDNPYIPEAEVAAARREMPEQTFRQEFEGVPTDDGANPFGLHAVRRNVVPACLDRPPVVYGLDLARALDYTVLLGLDAWAHTCRLERWQASWTETKARVAELVQQVPVVADATGVGDAIVEDLVRMGVQVTPHVFSQASKLRLMQRLVAAFQNDQLRVPEGWLVRELEQFEFTYTNTGVRYEAPSGLHDDGVMALGLALYGWDRVQGVSPEAIPAPVPVTDDAGVWRNAAEAQYLTAPVAGDCLSQLPVGGF
jgi:hypothetical protein